MGAATETADARLRVVPSSADQLAEWVAHAVADRRAGVLFCTEPFRAVAIDTEGRMAPALDSIAGKKLSFSARAPDRILVASDAREASSDRLERARVLVVGDTDASEHVSSALSARGAEVRTCADAAALDAASAFAPWLVVVSAETLGRDVAAPLVTNARLAAAALLVVRGDAASDAGALIAGALELTELERGLHAAVASGTLFIDRIESLEPSHWVKELGSATTMLALRAEEGVATLRIEGGRIREAVFRPAAPDAAAVTGRDAVKRALSLSVGEVFVGPPTDVERALAPPPPLPLVEPAKPPKPAAFPKLEAEKPKPAPKLEPVATPEPEPEPEPKPKLELVETPEPDRPQPEPEPELSALVEKELEKEEAEPRDVEREGRRSSLPPPQAPEESSNLAIWIVLALLLGGGVVWYLTADRPRSERDPERTLVPSRNAVVDDEPDDEATTFGQMGEPIGIDDPIELRELDPLDDLGVSPETDVPSLEPGTEEPVVPTEPVARPTGSAEELLARAVEAQERRQYAEAKELLEEVLALDAENADAAYRMALIHLRQRQRNEAREWIDRAIAWSPRDPANWLLSGDIYAQSGYLQLARRAWERCVALPASEPCRGRLERRGEAGSVEAP